MTKELRRIQPLKGIKNIPTDELGPLPEFRWVPPTDLYVDEEYQRDLRRRSMSLIEKIVKKFLWRRVKPIIVVELDDGMLHCIDGQHTAIAAATRGVPLIPIFVVQARTLEMRADAFVGHNRDRIKMDSLDVYRGQLAAKDPDAMDIYNVCERAGIRLRQTQTRGDVHIGDCMCVGVIGSLIRRHNPMKARKVLEALVKAECAPIQRVEIDAVEALMLIKYPNMSTDEAARIVMAVGPEGSLRAKLQAVRQKVPHKYKLFEAYVALVEKQDAA